jgi:N-acetylglutamate synthase-like GNAT family acetyltransferase
LNTLIDAIPAKADVMYLHDLALLPNARGKGYARGIVEQLAKNARADGWPAITLVAVNNSSPFWERHGFQAVDHPEMHQKLASYGPQARYMVRSLVSNVGGV